MGAHAQAHTLLLLWCVCPYIFFFFWKFAAFAIFGFSPAGLYSSACLLFVLLSFSFFFFYFRIKKKPMETTGWGRGWRVESAVAEKRWPRRMYEGRCCESCRELFCDWQAKNRFPPCFCFVFLFSFYFFQAIRQRAAPAQGDYQQWHGYGYGQYVYVFDVIIWLWLWLWLWRLLFLFWFRFLFRWRHAHGSPIHNPQRCTYISISISNRPNKFSALRNSFFNDGGDFNTHVFPHRLPFAVPSPGP